MNYLALGLMSGSSLDGLDIALCSFNTLAGHWEYKITAACCMPFTAEMKDRLSHATVMNIRDYMLLHISFGRYCGEEVKNFLQENHVVEMPVVIGSHGHTTFHTPAQQMTHQLGDGAALATSSGIAVVTDLRAVDISLGGQGAPIVPVGERLLFPGYRFFMNIGGICNVSIHAEDEVTAFDVSPANRVLNMLAADAGSQYDEGGKMAASGEINKGLLSELNDQDYYRLRPPKSLPNEFGTDRIYPLIKSVETDVKNALATYCEHIAVQTKQALVPFAEKGKMLITGGGAFNDFLTGRLRFHLKKIGIEVVVPDKETVSYKEALVMALIAVLRLREEPNVYASVTGAHRDSCGGALWSVK